MATIRSFLTVLVFAGMLVPAAAQAPAAPPLPEDRRYTFQPVEGGFLRLDGRTGQVSLCTRRTGDFACRTVPDDRAALEEEISRLTAENTRLRETARADGLGALKDQAKETAKTLIPNEQEVDKALTIMEGFMRRMMRIMREEAPPEKL
jgi:hypothetical protein